METQSLTKFFMFVVCLIVLLYDAWAVWVGGTPSSVSQWVTDTSGLSALQLIGVGIFIDHFFGWTMKRNRVRCPQCQSLFEIQTGKVIK
jgi:hypothetical protein